MKTFKHFLSVAIIISILSSCGVENGFIQKRKYNKGYHVSLKKKTSSNKAVNETEIVSNTETTTTIIDAKNEETRPEFSAELNAENSTSIEIAENNTESVSHSNKPTETVATKNAQITKTTSTRDFRKVKNNRIINTLTKSNTTSNGTSSTTSDVALILLVILAIILPPVAVGLYTDWETTPLVISIILTLLFWLPGIIHAFLVIFDII